jgi:AbrB family looped-hinge helix DNA binding protein
MKNERDKVSYYFWSLNMSYTLTSKGQVTIPKSMRLHLGVQQGDEVNFETLPDGKVGRMERPTTL